MSSYKPQTAIVGASGAEPARPVTFTAPFPGYVDLLDFVCQIDAGKNKVNRSKTVARFIATVVADNPDHFQGITMDEEGLAKLKKMQAEEAEAAQKALLDKANAAKPETAKK